MCVCVFFPHPITGSQEVAITGQVLENLPPIGVFWDIENCSVPSGRSAVAVVQRIREKFFKGHREAEFICVCDISKENKEVIEELNNCQVKLFGTSEGSNALLKQKMLSTGRGTCPIRIWV